MKLQQGFARVLTGTVALAAVAGGVTPASAHHVMGGRLPATFMEGLLSGLGHPVIGLDHFAAVVAIGLIAGAHRAGPALVIGFVLAMMAGVALHVGGGTVPFAELLVALTVVMLGVIVVWRRGIGVPVALGLFAATGLIHGYALGESIYGAERAPLAAYLAGLAVIQCAIALAAMAAGRAALRSNPHSIAPRLAGAAIAGAGFAILMQQVIPAP